MKSALRPRPRRTRSLPTPGTAAAPPPIPLHDDRIGSSLLLLGVSFQRSGSWYVCRRPGHTITFRIIDDELEVMWEDSLRRSLTWFDVLVLAAPFEVVLRAVSSALRIAKCGDAATAHAESAEADRLRSLIERLPGSQRSTGAVEALAYRCWCDDRSRPPFERFEESSTRARALQHVGGPELAQLLEEPRHRRVQPGAAIWRHSRSGANRVRKIADKLRRERAVA